MKDLIDRQAAIDAVHKEFDDCLVWDESGQRTADEFENIIDQLSSAQPTIEAIPIEWLEKKIEKCKSSKDLYPQLFEEIMTIVITEWRKENETN